MITMKKRHLEVWAVKNAAWLLITQFIATLLLLGAITSITLVNQRNINDLQATHLNTTRAVVRCATTETVVGLQRVVDKLGIRIMLEVPDTTGLDCQAILNVPLEQIEVREIPR